MKTDVIILAAGKGTRMRSLTPKILQNLANKPLLQHVVDTCSQIQNSKLHIIVGKDKKLIQSTVNTPRGTNWVLQKNQLGTGHAVKQALDSLRPGSVSLIMYGDVPMVGLATLKKLMQAGKSKLGLLTFFPDDPKGYGRILKNKNKVVSIIEEKDASTKEKEISEVNSGIISISSKSLKNLIPLIKNKNSAKEFYLTDIIELAVKSDVTIKTIHPSSNKEVLGANDLQDLLLLERAYCEMTAEYFISKGIKFADNKRVDFRGEIDIGKNSFVDINVIFDGKVKIGRNCKIGAGSVIRNSRLEDNVIVEPNSMIEEASVGYKSKVGPFAHVGPQVRLEKNVEIGNYVEVKRSQLGSNTKAKHLAYIGDAVIGESVNIGAGTIFVNYDGTSKNKTKVGSGAFIGSNSSLVAPLKIGKNSMIGAGSVVTHDIPDNKLAIARSRQKNIKKR